LSREARSWGYSRAGSAGTFADSYCKLLAVVRAIPMLAGFCYTQFADTYQEANGLLYADRTPKIPLDVIADATMGSVALPSVLPASIQDQLPFVAAAGPPPPNVVPEEDDEDEDEETEEAAE
jgi:hypothetical protein